MATTNTPPTLLVADAIAALSKSLNGILTKAEDEARVEIARAAAETREALREQDQIKKTLHENQLEEQAWKQEVGAWKASFEKVEIINKHQTETISQLRQEARQWKEQCLRLEETSRDWKEQFLRVEHERQILLLRIDELVAEKLAWSSQASVGASFHTPNSKYDEMAELSTSSATTKRASTSSNPFLTNGHKYKSVLPPSPTNQVSPPEALQKNPHPSQRSKTSRLRPQRESELEQVTPSHPAKDSFQSQPQTLSGTKTPRHPAQAHNTGHSQQRPASSPRRIVRQEMRSGPRQQVIRHVTATFEIPVKKEDVDDDEFEESASTSTPIHSTDVSPTTEILRARKPKSSYHKPRQQSKRSAQMDDDESYVEDENEGLHADASSSEEEDDELMMGVEDNPKEVYGTHRLAATPLRANGTSTVSISGGSSGKKRKLAVSRAYGGSATKARRL